MASEVLPSFADYRNRGFVAEGRFGRTYRVKRNTDGSPCILKLCAADDARVDAFRREIALMARIDHTNVLDLLDSFARPEDGAQAAVYPYCAGVALEKYIRRKKKLDEQTSIYFLRQLAAGLDYLRARDVALRMLSARNCLLYVNDQRPSIQIADFSTAGSVATGRPALDLDDLPLLSYLAPELLSGAAEWDFRVDIWSVGCVFFEMLTGTVAFDSSATASEVLLAQTEIESPEGISARSAALLSQGLLVVDPEERMTIDDVFDHPFCRSVVRPDVTNAEPLTDVVSEAGLTADQLARLQGGGGGGEGSSAAGSGDDETAEEGAAADAAEASAEDQAATTSSAAGAVRQGGGNNDAAAPAGGQGAGTNNGEVSAVDGASDPGNQSVTPTGRSATAQADDSAGSGAGEPAESATSGSAAPAAAQAAPAAYSQASELGKGKAASGIEWEGYVNKGKLGMGTFGVVYRAEREGTGELVAVKVCEAGKNTPAFQRELDLMSRVSHEHIIKLLDVIETESHISGVLEYCAGGDLHAYIKRKKRLDENTALFFLRQIVAGVECIHAHGLVHRDLKPHNFLLSVVEQKPIIKIADFGIATDLASRDGRAATMCGTPGYIAPEVLTADYYDAKCDMWSIGCIHFEMLAGRPPYVANNLPDLLAKMREGPPAFPDYVVASARSRDLVVKGLVVYEPDERMDLDQLFEQPFLRDMPRAVVAEDDMLGDGTGGELEVSPYGDASDDGEGTGLDAVERRRTEIMRQIAVEKKSVEGLEKLRTLYSGTGTEIAAERELQSSQELLDTLMDELEVLDVAMTEDLDLSTVNVARLSLGLDGLDDLDNDGGVGGDAVPADDGDGASEVASRAVAGSAPKRTSSAGATSPVVASAIMAAVGGAPARSGSSGSMARVASPPRSPRAAGSTRTASGSAPVIPRKDREGELFKLGGKTWQLKWFALTGDHLVIYESKEDHIFGNDPAGCLHLGGSAVTATDEPLGSFGLPADGISICVEVDGKKHYFRASDRKANKLWADAFETASAHSPEASLPCPVQELRRGALQRRVDKLKLRSRARSFRSQKLGGLEYDANDPSLFSGSVNKLGGRNKESWQKRYCNLQESALFYFQTAGSTPAGAIAITSDSLACPASIKDKDWAFFVMTVDRSQVLAVETEEELHAWLAALNSLIAAKRAEKPSRAYGNLLRCGYLQLHGRGGFGGKWQRRFVLLFDQHARYYSSHTDLSVAKGIIAFTRCTLGDDDAALGRKHNKPCFSLETAASESRGRAAKTYVWAAPSDAALVDWQAELEALLVHGGSGADAGASSTADDAGDASGDLA